MKLSYELEYEMIKNVTFVQYPLRVLSKEEVLVEEEEYLEDEQAFRGTMSALNKTKFQKTLEDCQTSPVISMRLDVDGRLEESSSLSEQGFGKMRADDLFISRYEEDPVSKYFSLEHLPLLPGDKEEVRVCGAYMRSNEVDIVNGTPFHQVFFAWSLFLENFNVEECLFSKRKFLYDTFCQFLVWWNRESSFQLINFLRIYYRYTLKGEKPEHFIRLQPFCILPSHLMKKIEEFNTRVEEKVWEGKRKDKVEGLLDFINYLLQKADKDRDSFSDSTELKEYVDSLSKIKEKLENKKDSLTEKEYYPLSIEVERIDDSRRTRFLNR